MDPARVANEQLVRLPPQLAGHDVVVFDGVCVLCSAFARFLSRRDRRDRFRFVTAQSPFGAELFRQCGLPTDVYETNLVIVDGVGFQRLDSLIAATGVLGWPWKATAALRILPRPARDWLYRRVALNRYALFGRRQSCEMPPGDLRDRLVG